MNARTAVIMIAVVAVFCCRSLDEHFGRGLELKEAVYPEAYAGPRPISARQALTFALQSLERRGVRDIRLCRLNWFVAAVGAAVVYATGHWEKDGVSFDAFAVGIHDGTEVKYGDAGGDEFFVLARGVDERGEETYYDGGGKGASARILRYKEIAADVDGDLLFEYASREVLAELPSKCGVAAAIDAGRVRHPSYVWRTSN